MSTKCLILDGGLATQLEAHGHVLGDSLWSARLLRDAPDEIQSVHREYLESGADVITTASYQSTDTRRAPADHASTASKSRRGQQV